MARHVRVRVNSEWYDVQIGDIYQSPVEVEVDGETYLVELEAAAQGAYRSRAKLPVRPKAELPGLRGILQGDDKNVRCPLPGKVAAVSVKKGQTLSPGDEICVLESMKMEQSVRMAHPGVVKNVKVKKAQDVIAGAPLIELQ